MVDEIKIFRNEGTQIDLGFKIVVYKNMSRGNFHKIKEILFSFKDAFGARILGGTEGEKNIISGLAIVAANILEEAEIQALVILKIMYPELTDEDIEQLSLKQIQDLIKFGIEEDFGLVKNFLSGLAPVAKRILTVWSQEIEQRGINVLRALEVIGSSSSNPEAGKAKQEEEKQTKKKTHLQKVK